jgi:non-canonical poly(A) RNA polymerase PAPD5/7
MCSIAANDIAKGSYSIARVRQTFAGAFNIMTAAAYMKASVLNSRRSGRSVKLRGHAEPTDLSILSSVLGVTQEVGGIEVKIVAMFNVCHLDD